MSVHDKALAALLRLMNTTSDRCWIVRGEHVTASEPCPDLNADQNGAVHSIIISRGLPWLSARCSRRWLGDRLFCFPHGLPLSRRVSVVSSRLRQRLDLETWWFDLVRTLTLQLSADSEAFVVAEGTTSCDVATRSAALFGRVVIRFDVRDQSTPSLEAVLGRWILGDHSRSSCSNAVCGTSIHSILVSPEFDDLSGHRQTSPETDGELIKVQSSMSLLPLGDRLLFAAADRAYVFSCRPNGIVADLARYHLEDTERRTVPLLFASSSEGKLPAITKDLPRGWIPWLLHPCQSSSAAIETTGVEIDPAAISSTDGTGPNLKYSESCPLANSHAWLQHWTRPAVGPWPGESSEEFLDSLILRTANTNRSALATLLRILTQGGIIASSDGIRGGHAVVALTAVPLREFRTRRVFRRHRHRFDFEPWGISVHRSALEHLDLRPVVYGDDAEWNKLEDHDQPWFQKASQGGETSGSSEMEWRIVGNLSLTELPRDSVRVFVDDAAAAELVRKHCPWQVVVVPHDR